ncbi:hypothetical protein J9317_03745 [Metabacillus sp. KIGAM252]|uniref:Uncharacterized protein n=1 Tax=Metabacillus flavus TaxID=2823519 RepID=A0ABS5LAY1_9BACI|nr:hypothetical protein [Metabacillus flavus]MBS2967888.1 hypothetical protein [Metabacillus flavus]
MIDLLFHAQKKNGRDPSFFISKASLMIPSLNGCVSGLSAIPALERICRCEIKVSIFGGEQVPYSVILRVVKAIQGKLEAKITHCRMSTGQNPKSDKELAI